MATAKQIAANKKNAQKSTGPKSQEGKERTRWNALQHGLASTHTILPHEDPIEFHQIRAELIDTYKPANALELMLVDEVAKGHWRMQRAHRFEAALFQSQLRILKHEHDLDPGPSALDDEAIAVTMLNPRKESGYRTYYRYDARAQSTFYRALDRLRQLQADRERRTQRELAAQPQPPKAHTPELASFGAGTQAPKSTPRPCGIMSSIVPSAILLGLLAATALFAADPQLSRPNTKATARISAADGASWDAWQKRTGERAPAWGQLPSQPFLPDPLEGVRTRADWDKRKAWIRAQYEHWITGKFPPAPTNLRATTTSERTENGTTIRDVLLEFGPGHKAQLHLQLLIPQGAGPFPVFLTNHPRTRPWIVPAVRRGYIGCIYQAADPMYGNPDDSEPYADLYPEYDFSATARWAWAGMRAVDYLHTLPIVDKEKIAISGHSRNGKQALIAAAFDERITAAIPSSGNSGEANPWRYTSDPFVNETIEQITSAFPGWFHPRLRFFAGREHKLPVDQNLLMAAIAPRALLMASAYSEGQGAPFGFEHAFRSVHRAYKFLNAENKLGLSLRPGEHATTAEDIERYIDFLDSVWERSTQPVPRDLMLPVAPAPKDTTIPARSASTRERIQWLLGDEPAHVPFPARNTLDGRTMTTEGWLGGLYNRPLKIDNVRAHAIPFGDDLKADLYVPDPLPAKPVPAVIWLHPYAHATGYSRYARPTIQALTSLGYAVFTFDQIGFGSRIHQATRFYHRYPKWSLLGKMVSDTRAAISAVAALQPIDASKVYLAGYSLGGKVALFTAALDDRVAGVIAASAFTPWRTPHPDTEGLAHYTNLHALIPRLAQFHGNEREIPVDYDEIVAAIAPKPVYIRAPQFDRYAHLPHIRRAVEPLKHVTLSTPVDFNRFGLDAQKESWEWLTKLP